MTLPRLQASALRSFIGKARSCHGTLSSRTCITPDMLLFHFQGACLMSFTKERDINSA